MTSPLVPPTVDHSRSLVVLLITALLAALWLYCRANPYFIPTIDDSAIVMRYLTNFQKGHFFTYNIGDGPVFGISGFWLGLSAGALSWLGLDPQAALMTVALIGTALFFFAVLRILLHTSDNLVVAIVVGACVFVSAVHNQKAMFLGLETPLHLWLVAEMLLAFLKQRNRLFYVLSVACVISKLDASFLVAFLMLMRLVEAWKAKEIWGEVKEATIFFLIPLLVWLVVASLIFGNPIPQSFLSKFFLRQKSPRTSWFPFLEPMIDSRQGLISMLLLCAAMVVSLIASLTGRLHDKASAVFALLFAGTMALYYVYNPGEKMPWYYPLPEFLALMCVACLFISALRSQAGSALFVKVAFIAISGALLVGVVHQRWPLSQGGVPAARAWQIVFEQERMATGELANAVAPKERPVLWTGHGYPAYMFNGYVVDYAGLNFRKIWDAAALAKQPDASSIAFLREMGLDDAAIHDPKLIEHKAGLLLMKIHQPNVYMQHSLFPATIQRARRMKLAGSFYTIDLVGAPAFRVFVEDANWNAVTLPIGPADLEPVEGEGIKKDALGVDVRQLKMRVPAHTSALLFGVKRTPEARVIVVQNSEGKLASCAVPAVENALGMSEVYACELPLPPVSHPQQLLIEDESGGRLNVFEPATTHRAEVE